VRSPHGTLLDLVPATQQGSAAFASRAAPGRQFTPWRECPIRSKKRIVINLSVIKDVPGLDLFPLRESRDFRELRLRQIHQGVAVSESYDRNRP